ncbi:unnamed protein product [Zymoseptoria tritici ST99CH_3D7]|uniref:Nitrogen permease regulator 3 n=1 Tax=Zymoseptoria tritici (strain ST99CH_3D7) TaxID=1276538 RepID=A0A1X7RIC7_ZYMT9|nr:unnamed protein product [Zymoseptoria tritici ST99CH_3D7]
MMASHPRSPTVQRDGDTDLVAVLLITRSRPGPRLVFHYPENPLANDKPSEDPDTDPETDDDEIANATFASRTPLSARTTLRDVPELGRMSRLKLHNGTPGRADAHVIGGQGEGGELLTGTVLGHSVESLEKVLSPGRWSEGKKFEIALGGCTFLGFPVFVPEGGEWGGEKRDEKLAGKGEGVGKKEGNGLLGAELLNARSEDEVANGEITPLVGEGGREIGRDGGEGTEYDYTHMPDSFEEKPAKSTKQMLGTSVESSSTNSNTTHSATTDHLTMFQVVFVLRPEQAASAGRIYKDFVKRLGKALHYCQKQSGYVANESRKMLAMKAKVRQQARITREDEVKLWEKMIEGSELAWVLREIYQKLSTGEVAEFRLSGMEMSLHTSPPPPPTESHASHRILDGPLQPNPPPPEITPTSALLLLEPPSTLLTRLPTTPPSPLTLLLPSLTSTKTLSKLSVQLALPIATTLALAHHLVTWRKAMHLPAPLHWRNTYVVAPNAPLSKLHVHMEEYKALFPTLPGLGNMLKVLSGKPIRYALLVPSRDHRGKYMEILEFLWRQGWVVQLKTFGWLSVPRYLLEAPGVVGLEGRFLRDVAVFDDDSGSVSSERTAIANGRSRGGDVLGRSKRASDATQISMAASSNGTVRDAGEGGKAESVLVTDPAGERWLGRNLAETFEEGEGREIVEGMVGLLDGETAVEEFAGRLGVKRGRVEEVVEELEGRGWLRLVRCI